MSPGIGSRALSKLEQADGGRVACKLKRVQERGKKGPTAQRRSQKARKVLLSERAIKAEAKRLDAYRCRWPDCEVPQGTFWGQIDPAHVQAEGMGGDPTLQRTTLENILAVCRWHHRGPRSLHSGHLKVEKLTPQGTRGPMACYELQPGESGKWALVGIGVPPSPEQVAAFEEGEG